MVTKPIAPPCVILLLDIKLMLEPIALLVIAPVWVIPILSPAAALFPVTVMLPPPALIVIAPKETIVLDAPPVPVTVNDFAVINPVAVIGVAVAVEVDWLADKLRIPPLIAPVVSIPAAVVDVAAIVIACPVAVIEPVL